MYQYHNKCITCLVIRIQGTLRYRMTWISWQSWWGEAWRSSTKLYLTHQSSTWYFSCRIQLWLPMPLCAFSNDSTKCFPFKVIPLFLQKFKFHPHILYRCICISNVNIKLYHLLSLGELIMVIHKVSTGAGGNGMAMCLARCLYHISSIWLRSVELILTHFLDMLLLL